jgi:hypothetical protein
MDGCVYRLNLLSSSGNPVTPRFAQVHKNLIESLDANKAHAREEQGF